MPEAQIILMRHAEKPDKDRNEIGLSPAGQPDEHALSARGWQRAGALALLLGRDSRVQVPLPTPDRILASAFRKNGGRSHRPEQTVQPLADRLSLSLDLTWSLNQEQALASDLRRRTGVHLVCWQHDGLPALARAIAAPDDLTEIPETWAWPSERFDVFWLLSRASATTPWRFAQHCQCLLPGDADRPLLLSPPVNDH
ncbi:hypothetical protein [Nguyenibacter vanlangensis]|uniref:Histidine phosphatase family protein n=1 Tax=Nguyenibacter vanlangensis TaxID=1216886 RepID=A0A7Y7ITK1_9PROT|nr:hypothetical protein [Nguyenibacter vanlangensis]NVN09570.1 hypothetical protein [Nguyenibacter vanlangensis]